MTDLLAEVGLRAVLVEVPIRFSLRNQSMLKAQIADAPAYREEGGLCPTKEISSYSLIKRENARCALYYKADLGKGDARRSPVASLSQLAR